MLKKLKLILAKFIFRFLHFIFAVSKSWILIFSCIILTIVVLFLNSIFKNELWISFFVGISASIIATLILKITEAYLSSIRAEQSIIIQTTFLINFFDKVVFVDNYNDKSFSQDFERMYYEICITSHDLTYDSYYNKLIVSIKSFIDTYEDRSSSYEDALVLKKCVMDIIDNYLLN